MQIEVKGKSNMSSWWPLFLQSGALYSLNSNSFIVGYGALDQKKSSDSLDSQLPAFYFPDFFLQDHSSWKQFSQWRQIEREQLQVLLDKGSSSLSSIDWSLPAAKEWQEIVEKLQQEFRVSKLKKVVPYLFSKTSLLMTSTRLIQCLKKATAVLNTYPGYLYGFWHEGRGMVGVTPEILFSYDFLEKELSLMALAGTADKNRERGELMRSAKELEEHQFVIQGIRNSLASLGVLSTGALQLLELPTFNHLFTPLSLSLRKTFDFDSIVSLLHPTPALGAFPKEEGWQWLSSYNIRFPRGRYGAPVGLFHSLLKKAHCLVAIRNVQWDERGMQIGAGCGITQQSQWREEWKEWNLKVQSVRALLAL